MNTVTIILVVLLVLAVNTLFLQLAVKLFIRRWLTIGEVLAYYGVAAILGIIAYFVITKTSLKTETPIVALSVQSLALQLISGGDISFMKSIFIVVVFNLIPVILLFMLANFI